MRVQWTGEIAYRKVHIISFISPIIIIYYYQRRTVFKVQHNLILLYSRFMCVHH